jgi:NADPH-dependent ferric siderophore reductase
MPTVPSALASGMDRLLGRDAVVTAVTRLSVGLIEARFAVRDLVGRVVGAGQEIEVRVGARELRHYTPTAFDSGTGEFSVIFARSADGPGTAWAESLRDGQRVRMFGPAGHGRYAVVPGGTHLFLGDATALGLFDSLVSALPEDGGVLGAVEVPEVDVDAAAKLAPALEVLPQEPEVGLALRAWLDRFLADSFGHSPPADVGCLAGHTQTLQVLRTTLRERGGMSRRSLTLKSHWATGRHGL